MIQTYLLTFLLFFLPFVILPFGTSYFETPKILIAQACIITLIIFFIFNYKSISLTKFTYILIAIAAVSIFDLIFFSSKISFLGNPFRMQGIFLLWLLLFFSYRASFIHMPKFSARFFFILIVIHTLAAFFMDFFNKRAIGTLGDPNMLAATFIFLLPFLLFAKKKARFDIILKTLGVILAGVIIFLSGSRSGIIAFGIELIFFILLKVRLQPKLAVFFCVFLILASLSLVLFEHESYDSRKAIWQMAISAVAKHPILGSGFGNTEYAIIKEASSHGKNFPYVDSAHNIFLDWTIQAGFIGLFLLTVLFYMSFRQNLKKHNYGLIMSLLGILAALQFNPAGITTLLALWWIMGASFSTGNFKKTLSLPKG